MHEQIQKGMLYFFISDLDGDGVADSIDSDVDGDGVINLNDAFPTDPSETADLDGDGVGDNGDAYPTDPSKYVIPCGDSTYACCGANTLLLVLLFLYFILSKCIERLYM